jgi:hypothetical protein
MSLHQNNKRLLVHHKRSFVSHWPPASEIGMLLITNVLELRVVAGISRTLAGHQHAVSGRPMLIHTYHAIPMPSPCCNPAMASRGHFQEDIIVAWHGNGMVWVNQTQPHCVNQMGKTQSNALVERHGTGMAWERCRMCDSNLRTTWWMVRSIERMALDSNVPLIFWAIHCNRECPFDHSGTLNTIYSNAAPFLCHKHTPVSVGGKFWWGKCVLPTEWTRSHCTPTQYAPQTQFKFTQHSTQYDVKW